MTFGLSDRDRVLRNVRRQISAASAGSYRGEPALELGLEGPVQGAGAAGKPDTPVPLDRSLPGDSCLGPIVLVSASSSTRKLSSLLVGSMMRAGYRNTS